MKRTISTYFYEEAPELLRAEIFQDENGVGIQYIKSDSVFNEERFPGKTLRYVEDAAENWALGIKKI